MKKGAFRNFSKFTGKHLCQILSFNKVAGQARYERVSRKNLPSNRTIRRTRTIGSRNRHARKKRMRFADTAT